jgi:hypothetical protein
MARFLDANGLTRAAKTWRSTRGWSSAQLARTITKRSSPGFALVRTDRCEKADAPCRVRVSPSAHGEGIHAHDRGRRPDRFESGSRHSATRHRCWIFGFQRREAPYSRAVGDEDHSGRYIPTLLRDALRPTKPDTRHRNSQTLGRIAGPLRVTIPTRSTKWGNQMLDSMKDRDPFVVY